MVAKRLFMLLTGENFRGGIAQGIYADDLDYNVVMHVLQFLCKFFRIDEHMMDTLEQAYKQQERAERHL